MRLRFSCLQFAVTFYLFFFTLALEAAEDANFKFDKPIIVESETVEFNNTRLRDYFSDIPEFNYFGSQAIGASASVFMYGLDQRYFDINYNGYKLEDPTTPLGALEVSSLSRLSGMKVVKNPREQSLNVLNKSESNSVGGQVTSLKEFSVDGFYKANKNFFLKSGFSRLGGFNQTQLGSEKDWTEEVFIAPSLKFKIDDYQLSTDFLYTYKDQDFDSFLSGEEDSEGVSRYLFAGQSVKRKKTNLKFSYTQIRKTFNEGLDFEPFNFEAKVLNAEFTYNESLQLKSQFETNGELEDSKIYFSYIKDSFGFYFSSSKLRGEFYSLDLKPTKTITLFYKEIEPSLFQITFNEGQELEKQKALGLQYENSYTYKEVDFKLSFLYQRSFDQVEYNFISNTYENFQRVENVFFNLLSQWKSLGLYIQIQSAEDLVLNQSLPRRSPLSFGLDYKFKLRDFTGAIQAAWHSERKAFDGSELSNFMTSSLALGRKRFQIVVTNVLNQDSQVYKDFRRKPVTVELNYLYKF